ncbi:MAG: TetR/AcrR family transcriptional regulator, partial [Lacticaseibacillus paracasei]|nr:TetR/AcrR family transcriptional regulator [Lacticaseibacillus paracasei]
ELAEQFNRELSGKAARLYATYQANGQLVDWPFNRVLRAIFGTVLSYLLPLIIGEQSAFDLETAVHEAVEFLERGLRA